MTCRFALKQKPTARGFVPSTRMRSKRQRTPTSYTRYAAFADV